MATKHKQTTLFKYSFKKKVAHNGTLVEVKGNEFLDKCGILNAKAVNKVFAVSKVCNCVLLYVFSVNFFSFGHKIL